jgi:hypothetical protein
MVCTQFNEALNGDLLAERGIMVSYGPALGEPFRADGRSGPAQGNPRKFARK